MDILPKIVVLTCILGTIGLPAYSSDKTMLEVNVYIQPIERDFNTKEIKMMKGIAERQWNIQNETTMKVDYQKEVINALKQGDYDKAIEICNNAFDYEEYVSKRTIADYYSFIGLAYLKKSYYAKAIQYCNIAISKYDNEHIQNASVYYTRGLARIKINDLDGAKDDFNKSLSLGLKIGNAKLINGDNTYIYIDEKFLPSKIEFSILDYFIMPSMNKYCKLALISKDVKKGQYEKVLHFYSKYIKGGNKIAETYNNIGVYYMEQQDYPKALENFNNSLKQNSEIIEPYFNLALLYYSINEYNKANENISKYEELQKKQTQNYKVWNYGTAISYTDSEINKYIEDMLKANINLKLQNYRIANEIYSKYKINNFNQNSIYYKYEMNYLPLLEGSAYQYILTKKYKKAINRLLDMRTAEYHSKYNDEYEYRGKYFYIIPPANEHFIDINNGYEVVENAYILNNIAILEYIIGKQDEAMEDINWAKNLAFKFNDIELYKQIIKTYNFIKSKAI